jgi:hypothetical protein
VSLYPYFCGKRLSYKIVSLVTEDLLIVVVMLEKESALGCFADRAMQSHRNNNRIHGWNVFNSAG